MCSHYIKDWSTLKSLNSFARTVEQERIQSNACIPQVRRVEHRGPFVHGDQQWDLHTWEHTTM